MTNEIRTIKTSELSCHLSSKPYDVYVEALRRKTSLHENPLAWTAKRLPKTNQEFDILTKVIRAYYAADPAR
jgi:hypothetical protein